MKSAIGRAKLAREQDLAAIRRLDAQARRLEQGASGPSLAAIIAEERARSHEHDGRSVFVWEPPADAGPASGQQPG